MESNPFEARREWDERYADLVLVLDRGQIIERGTHDQLVARGGEYANLYRQFVRATEA